MQSRKTGIGIAIVGLVVVIVLFVVLSGDDSSDDSGNTAATNTSAGASQTAGGGSGGGEAASSDEPVITIKDGAAVGGVQDLSFDKGDPIRFEVDSDAAWEIHFHGYDVMKDVPKNGSVEFNVPGDADGVYEVEIEDTATQIAEITVNP